jgi:hypothetical protein
VNQGGSVLLEVQPYVWHPDPFANPSGWQWSFNGTPIPGANSSFLRLTNVSAAHAGTYTLSATNAYGSATRSISLTVESRVRTLFTVQRPLPTDAAYVYDLSQYLLANRASQLYLLGSHSNGVWFLAKYRQNGERLWSRQFGPVATPIGMVLDARENIVVAGTTNYFRKGVVVLAKYSPDGALLWEKRLASTNGTARYTMALAQNAAGNLYVSGQEAQFSGPRIFLTKLTANGTPVWTRYIASPIYYPDQPALAPALDGGVFVAAPSGLVRFSAAGQKLWTRGGYFSEAAIAPGGSVYVTGPDGTARYTPSGTRLWKIPLRGYDMNVDTNGLLLGVEDQLYRLAPNGATRWSMSLHAGALALDGAGRAYACTITPGLVTRALDLQGRELWQAMELAPASPYITYPSDLVVCPNGDVAVAHAIDGNYILSRYRPGAISPPLPLPISSSATAPVTPGTRVCFTLDGQPQNVVWFRNGLQVPFETNSTLCVTADWNTDGSYSAAAFSSDGAVFSREIDVQVLRPYISPLQPISENQMLLRVIPLAEYGPIRVERSSDLQNWQTITNVSTAQPVYMIVPRLLHQAQFFRAVAQ